LDVPEVREINADLARGVRFVHEECTLPQASTRRQKRNRRAFEIWAFWREMWEYALAAIKHNLLTLYRRRLRSAAVQTGSTP